jgi:hypothetical protein
MKTIPVARLVLPFVTAFALLSLGTTAEAQQPAPAPPAPPAPPPAPAAPPPASAPAAPVPPTSTDVPPPQPPAEVPPPPADVPPPASATLDERMADVEAKIEGLNETLTVTNSTLSPIAKLKFSGYIQGRYEWREDSYSGVDSMNRPTNFDRFLVRRARLKATYVGENAEYMLQIDSTGDGTVLRDAEATFVDTWTPLGIRATAGQFKIPFGYEVLQSSGDREMPERARVIRALFPNERDRGVRVQARYDWLRFSGAAVNGTFIGDAVYGTTDQNRYADLVGRLGGDFDFLVVGVSGQFGQKLVTPAVTPARVSGTDTNMDGVITGDEITAVTPTSVPVTRRFDIWRFGMDAQAYFDIPGVGGMALKGELVMGGEKNLDFRGMNADACRDVKQFGWILTAIQNFGDSFGMVARLDQWNPNRDVAAGTSSTCTTAAGLAANDKITTLGGGLLYYISGNLKLSGVYEHVWRSDTLGRTGAPASAAPSTWIPADLLTFQLQAKF